MGFLLQTDTFLFKLFNIKTANPVFDFLMPFITNGTTWIIPGLAALALMLIKEKKQALYIVGLALVTVACTDLLCVRVLKPLFARLRPCHPAILVEGGRFLLGNKTSFSFPSAHAMNTFGQAFLFSYFYRQRWYWFFCLAALIGYSRVYMGVHFPMDVAGGALGGVACAIMIIGLAKQVRVLYNKYRNES